jgi:methanogenic corrinoid protein MtbC1
LVIIKNTFGMQEIQDQLQKILNEKKNIIAKEVVEKQYSRAIGFWEQYGEEGKRKGMQDVEYHLSFLSEAIQLEDKDIFTEYIEWVKLLFREIYLPESVIINTLEITDEVLKGFLSHETYNVASPYLEAGFKKASEPVHAEDSYIHSDTEMGKLAKKFNELLLEGRRNDAGRLIFKEVDNGRPIKDVYLKVFQPSQMEVGRLWLLNRISVAKEHYVSAATQMIMSQLYPYIFSTERKGLTFIGACAGGELHEIGLRMVCDFFEMDGWDTYYLGANTPAQAIIEAIQQNKADVIGLSIAMPFHQSLLKQLIEKIKTTLKEKRPKILVGGNGINSKKKTWKFIGADGYAKDANEAVGLANKIIV